MKKLLLPFVLCLPLAAQGLDVQGQEKKWVAALRANDLGGLEKLLSANLVYTHSTGIVENRTEYLGKLKSGDQKYANVEYSDVKTQDFGQAALLSATVRMTGASKGVPFDNKLKMLHVWAKEKDGNWRLVAHQTTRLP